MRAIVFFDLPTETKADRREYTRFRKTLIKNGFIMMQESVYCRLLINASAEKAVADILRKNRPPGGIVQLLTVTEKQFAGIECISGSFHTDVVSDDSHLVII